MKRVAIKPRADWEKKVEQIGLIYHHTEDHAYWNESAYYSFRSTEIDRIELATNELHEAWEDEPPAIYGRFDLAYDGEQLKLLEYNADTPTALLEASVVQWYWLQDLFPQTRPVQLDS